MFHRTDDGRKQAKGSRLILTIEDDAAIRRGLVDALQFAGYAVDQAKSAQDGLSKAIARSPDLVLLDWILPEGDGLMVLQQLRQLRPTLPVLLLTARGEEVDRVRGLRCGRRRQD